MEAICQNDLHPLQQLPVVDALQQSKNGHFRIYDYE